MAFPAVGGNPFAREAPQMKIVNSNELEELEFFSPRGTFGGYGKQISEALGRDARSTDLMQRHPFDVEIQRIPAGKSATVYHSHSAQWEFYHVISGTGKVRHEQGTSPIKPGDAFLCKPGDAHQLQNDGGEDLVVYVIADNPLGEAHYYPDSNKWGVPLPDRRFVRSEPLDYFDGEE